MVCPEGLSVWLAQGPRRGGEGERLDHSERGKVAGAPLGRTSHPTPRKGFGGPRTRLRISVRDSRQRGGAAGRRGWVAGSGEGAVESARTGLCGGRTRAVGACSGAAGLRWAASHPLHT